MCHLLACTGTHKQAHRHAYNKFSVFSQTHCRSVSSPCTTDNPSTQCTVLILQSTFFLNCHMKWQWIISTKKLSCCPSKPWYYFKNVSTSKRAHAHASYSVSLLTVYLELHRLPSPIILWNYQTMEFSVDNIKQINIQSEQIAEMPGTCVNPARHHSWKKTQFPLLTSAKRDSESTQTPTYGEMLFQTNIQKYRKQQSTKASSAINSL